LLATRRILQAALFFHRLGIPRALCAAQSAHLWSFILWPRQRHRRALPPRLAGVVNRRCPPAQRSEDRHRRGHPATPPNGGVEGQGAKRRSKNPRRAATRARKRDQGGEAKPGTTTEELSATPTTEQDSDRAQRGWKRRPVPTLLMPFSFLPRIWSFSGRCEVIFADVSAVRDVSSTLVTTPETLCTA
jgi:hypothetical protein